MFTIVIYPLQLRVCKIIVGISRPKPLRKDKCLFKLLVINNLLVLILLIDQDRLLLSKDLLLIPNRSNYIFG